MTDQGEPLAGGTAKYDIHLPAPYPGSLPDLGSGQSGHRLREHDASWKVVFVYSAMDRVYFNCGDNIETGLLEAQSKAPSASKQIDSDWSCHPQSPAFSYQLTGSQQTCRSESYPEVPERK
jgi:hypothetical protein